MQSDLLSLPRLSSLSDLPEHELVAGLKMRVQTERRVTAEIVAYIQEIDRRRIYLRHGVTSLFAFLTEVIGYSRAAAQRRIEAARLSNDVPEIQEALKSGELNLSQVSVVAQAVKQKEKAGAGAVSPVEKQELIKKIKGQSVEKCEVIVSQALDLSPKTHDTCRYQKDESLRAEMTFTKSELAEIERAKSLLSHQLGNPELSELFVFLVRDLLKRKDPLREKPTPESGSATRQSALARIRTFRAATRERFTKELGKVHTIKSNKRVYMRVGDARALHARDKSCRWRDPRTGHICNSTFRLQRDHIVPLWAGGTNELENFQLLCAAHNRLKYEMENGA
ncbi:MAG TPA: DUF222 domain-containing protein [Bdellovibrionales bacterium]|nr:DUF222 domain-containing protein [Bdellovibrionales bacterium]